MAQGTWVQSQVKSYQRLKKKKKKKKNDVNTQHYKVWIKDKVGQYWKRSNAFLYTLV